MPLLIADASPIIGFVAGSQHALLWQVIKQTHGQIVVPNHVDVEIKRITKKKGLKAINAYQWMKKQSQVNVLPKVGILGPVAATTATLLGATNPGMFHSHTTDLGEAFTVAHARQFERSGTPADVLIDDTKGGAWAKRYQISCRGTVWIFTEAITQQRITTKADLRTAYNAVARHSTLPMLKQTGLLDLI